MTYADQKKTPAESPHPDLQKSYVHEQLYEHSRWIRNPAIFLLSATSLLKFLILRLIILSPGSHGIHDGLQAVAKLRQGVFHPGRHLRINLPGQKAAGLHLAKLRSQNFLRDMPNRTLKLPEAFRSRQKIPEDQNLPFIADKRQRRLHRAGWEVFFTVFEVIVVIIWFSFRLWGSGME